MKSAEDNQSGSFYEGYKSKSDGIERFDRSFRGGKTIDKSKLKRRQEVQHP